MLFKYNALSFIKDGDKEDDNNGNHWITRDTQKENTLPWGTQEHAAVCGESRGIWFLEGCC